MKTVIVQNRERLIQIGSLIPDASETAKHIWMKLFHHLKKIHVGLLR